MKDLPRDLQLNLGDCFRSFIREASVKLPEYTYLIIVPELRITEFAGVVFTARALPYTNIHKMTQNFKLCYDTCGYDTIKNYFARACTIPIGDAIPNWQDILDDELYSSC